MGSLNTCTFLGVIQQVPDDIGKKRKRQSGQLSFSLGERGIKYEITMPARAHARTHKRTRVRTRTRTRTGARTHARATAHMHMLTHMQMHVLDHTCMCWPSIPSLPSDVHSFDPSAQAWHHTGSLHGEQILAHKHQQVLTVPTEHQWRRPGHATAPAVPTAPTVPTMSVQCPVARQVLAARCPDLNPESTSLPHRHCHRATSCPVARH